MRTIGHHWPTESPRGDRQAECSFCGVPWLRSELRVDRAGRYVCPDEGDGYDEVELVEMNQAAAVPPPVTPDPGGALHLSGTVTPPTPLHGPAGYPGVPPSYKP